MLVVWCSWDLLRWPPAAHQPSPDFCSHPRHVIDTVTKTLEGRGRVLLYRNQGHLQTSYICDYLRERPSAPVWVAEILWPVRISSSDAKKSCAILLEQVLPWAFRLKRNMKKINQKLVMVSGLFVQRGQRGDATWSQERSPSRWRAAEVCCCLPVVLPP